MTRTLGIVTVGQAPRDDIAALFAAHAPAGTKVVLRGALDGLSDDEVDRLQPENGADTLYTRLALDDPGAGTWSSRYLDPAAGAEVVVTADAAFREAILFAPSTRPVLCIEPYTCATDALNLQARGVDAGLLTLPPGGRWSAGYTISARAITYAS